MTALEQIQSAIWAMASTVHVWRDLAIAGLAAFVVILLFTAASAR